LEDVNLNNAKGMLVNISASSDFKMKEYHEVMNIIKQYAAENAHVIVGNVIDDAMGNQIRVTMVATGLAYSKEEENLNMTNNLDQNNSEVLREFIYKPDADVAVDDKETLEANDEYSPNVFGSNTSDEDSLNEAVMSDEEEYDIPAFMRRKNK
jgi:cell division protein FtsZ